MSPEDFFHGPIGSHLTLRGVTQQAMVGVWQEVPESRCLPTDIHAYLLSIISAIPLLAKRLSEGDHMTTYINAQIDDIDRHTDFSDIAPLDDLQDKFDSLNEFVASINRAFESIQRDLDARKAHHQQPPNIPAEQPTISLAPLASDTQRQMPTPAASYLGNPPSQVSPGYSDPADPAEQAMSPANQEMMEQVSARGKSQWTCPYTDCKAGGYRDGVPVVFERNSAARAHLQKHLRPFRCQLPGCTNKKGFARIDQLHRHQEIARHDS